MIGAAILKKLSPSKTSLLNIIGQGLSPGKAISNIEGTPANVGHWWHNVAAGHVSTHIAMAATRLEGYSSSGKPARGSAAAAFASHNIAAMATSLAEIQAALKTAEHKHDTTGAAIAQNQINLLTIAIAKAVKPNSARTVRARAQGDLSKAAADMSKAATKHGTAAAKLQSAAENEAKAAAALLAVVPSIQKQEQLRHEAGRVPKSPQAPAAAVSIGISSSITKSQQLAAQDQSKAAADQTASSQAFSLAVQDYKKASGTSGTAATKLITAGNTESSSAVELQAAAIKLQGSLAVLAPTSKTNTVAPNPSKTVNIPAFASGGIVRASPGGTIVRVAEAGQDELVLPLPSGAAGALPALATAMGSAARRSVPATASSGAIPSLAAGGIVRANPGIAQTSSSNAVIAPEGFVSASSRESSGGLAPSGSSPASAKPGATATHVHYHEELSVSGNTFQVANFDDLRRQMTKEQQRANFSGAGLPGGGD